MSSHSGSNSGNRGNSSAHSSRSSGGDKDLPTNTKESISKKLNDHLLNPEHPVGRSKAKWFQSALGFTVVAKGCKWVK